MTAMKKSGICPKCNSPRIIADATVVDRDRGGNRDLSVATYRNKDAFIFTGKQETALSAWVCAACGFTELYANRPLDLIQPEN